LIKPDGKIMVEKILIVDDESDLELLIRQRFRKVAAREVVNA